MVASCGFAAVRSGPKKSSRKPASSRKLAAAGRPDPELVRDVAYANRILYDRGVLDAYGHVSARHDKNSKRFLLARNMAPALVTTADVLEHDLEGEPIVPGIRPYLERFLHAAIYRARPDVIAIVHSHSPSVIPFGVTGTALRPIVHMGGFLGEGAPIFEIREAGGMTDMLISDNSLGDALARTMGSSPAAILRGHGSVVTGNSIMQAVWRAVFAEVNARLQIESMRLGPINFLMPEEAKKASDLNDSQMPRAWNLWKRIVGQLD
jgi:ribulose-5-phosphate 4-epimerase/fuculose-1-phosphate aldolase